MRSKVLVAIQVVLIALSLGCPRKLPTTNGPTLSSSPTAPTAESPAETAVELSEAEVSNRAGTNGFVCSVHYRFVKGQPQPGTWYYCSAELEGQGDLALANVDGKDLKQEGTLKGDFLAIRPGAKGFKIKMLQAPKLGGPYRSVSNTLSGQVQVVQP
jgi:hypothetical protein